jgi:hypothetical protein
MAQVAATEGGWPELERAFAPTRAALLDELTSLALPRRRHQAR